MNTNVYNVIIKCIQLKPYYKFGESVSVRYWIFGFINLCNTYPFIRLVSAENVKLYQFNFINYAHVYARTVTYTNLQIYLLINRRQRALHLSQFTTPNALETATMLEYIAAIGVAATINNRTTFIINRFAAAIRPHNVPHTHTRAHTERHTIIIILLQSSAFTNYVNSSHHISNNYIIIIMIISTIWYHVKHKFSYRFGVWLLLLLCFFFASSVWREKWQKNRTQTKWKLCSFRDTMQFMEASHVHVWTQKTTQRVRETTTKKVF